MTEKSPTPKMKKYLNDARIENEINWVIKDSIRQCKRYKESMKRICGESK